MMRMMNGIIPAIKGQDVLSEEQFARHTKDDLAYSGSRSFKNRSSIDAHTLLPKTKLPSYVQLRLGAVPPLHGLSPMYCSQRVCRAQEQDPHHHLLLSKKVVTPAA